MELKGAGISVNRTAGSCRGEAERGCCLLLRDMLENPSKSVLNRQELALDLRAWARDVRLLPGKEREHRPPGKRGVKVMLAFFTARSMLRS